MLNFSAIVLAAGQGKRMKSSLPKVLHGIAGRPMIARTVEILKEVSPKQIIIIVSPKSLADVKKNVSLDCQLVVQKIPLGTADAVRVGLTKVNKDTKTIAVLYGDDTAFYKPETIKKVFQHHRAKNPTVTFVTVKKKDSTGLGRIVRTNGKLVAIVEEKDATSEQRKIKEVNDGLYFFDKRYLEANLSNLTPSRVTSELYITDMIELALSAKQKVETYQLANEREWQSINTKEELEAANQKLRNRIHIMGISGAGASAVAGIAKEQGFEVSGCDLVSHSSYTENLDIKITRGHSPSHLGGSGLLVISPAITKFDPRNPEVIAAQKTGIPVLTWQQFQGQYLQKGKFVIAVSGAYGKSTTTAMISQILIDQDLDPTCEIGASVLGWGVNFKVGKSKYYVCEADEYNNNFLNYNPDISVVLSVAWDHPDFFKSERSVINSYKKFVAKIKKGGTLIIPGQSSLLQFTSSARPDVNIVKVGDFGKLNLSIIGDFRKENANGALSVAKVLGLDLNKAKESVKNFKGTGRRLEYKGEIKSVKFYDDYGVQPYTIKTTANALCDKFKEKRVVLVFEPHTFSRIETFFDDFIKSLKETKVDQILITDIFAAREHGDSEGLAKKLVESIGNRAVYCGSLEEAANYVMRRLVGFDVVLSMGAGNIYKLYDMVSKK